MNDLTLIIPAKYEEESLPAVLDELKKYNYKINIVLHQTDKKTIESIKEHGVNIVIYANHMMRSSYPAMIETAKLILKNERSYETEKNISTVKEMIELIH